MKNARKKQIVNPSKKTTALEKPKKYRRNSRQSSKKSMIRECEQIQSIILPFIALSATICGAESYRDFEAFGKAQFKWLKEFFPLKHGIPSHDTFCRVFNLLEPKSFEKAYRLFIESLKIRTTNDRNFSLYFVRLRKKPLHASRKFSNFS